MKAEGRKLEYSRADPQAWRENAKASLAPGLPKRVAGCEQNVAFGTYFPVFLFYIF